MRAILLAATLAVAGVAHAAPPIDAPATSEKIEDKARKIGDRARELLPIKTFRISWLKDSEDGKNIFVLTISLAKVPGAPRTVNTGLVLLPGEGDEKIEAALADIARELQQILDNVKAGRPWNAQITPIQPLPSAF